MRVDFMGDETPLYHLAYQIFDLIYRGYLLENYRLKYPGISDMVSWQIYQNAVPYR